MGYKLVLLRHAESLWNLENEFTGWTDVPLTREGQQKAAITADLLYKEGFSFDVVHTSLLKRAIKTMWIVLEELDLMWIPVNKTWRLNERFYGGLQGLNKADTIKKFGEEQVHEWRRSFSIRPPAITKEDYRYPRNDKKYSYLDEKNIPLTESLKDTIKRTMVYWNDKIIPDIKADKSVLIVAHGNSLRGIVKHLDNISEEKISELNIPTGIPLIYELDEDLKPIKHYYLGNDKDIEAQINRTKNIK